MDLIERIGGKLTLIALAIIFYNRLEKDNRVNQFLHKINLSTIEVSKNKICTSLLGLQHYFVKDGQIRHEEIVLSELKQEHLEIMVQHLKKSMISLKIDHEIIDEVCEKLD